MKLNKADDLLSLQCGETVTKRNLFDLIQFSKVEGSPYWQGSHSRIGNTPQQGTIRLNTELAKKPKACLEYLVVHEMVHLIEPTHNERFVGTMDLHLPNWRHTRNVLNDLPVRHEAWRY